MPSFTYMNAHKINKQQKIYFIYLGNKEIYCTSNPSTTEWDTFCTPPCISYSFLLVVVSGMPSQFNLSFKYPVIPPYYPCAEVESFIYLGSLVPGNVSEEITNRLIAANRSYFGLKSQFKSHLLSRKTKILKYKTVVRPILTYAAETWTATKSYKQRLSIFKRKILCRIYGPICERGQ